LAQAQYLCTARLPPVPNEAAAPGAMARLFSAVLLVLSVSPVLALKASLRSIAAAEVRVTPVERVVALLVRLEAQIGEEGKSEAAEYDKYACFCKQQADSKNYAIGVSKERIAALDATIEVLKSEITDLDLEAANLGTEITDLGTDIKTEKDLRKDDHAKYLVADTNVTEAITAVTDAIAALKASKASMSGAKLNLAQVQALTGSAFGVVAMSLGASTPGTAPAYTYSSNDIIATLQSLLKDFKLNKKSLDQSEFDKMSASEKKVLGLSNQKKFKEKAKLEKEELSAAKTTKQHGLEQDRTDEDTAMKADDEFLTELTTQCEARATEWDQRSKARASELSSLAEAIETLKTGVAPVYSANKKLVGLQRRVVVQAAARPAAASFLQLQGEQSGAAVHKALEVLGAAAARLQSPALSALAASAALRNLGPDHFVKVRGLIKDLVSRLEAEALSEAESKTFCDKQMSAAVTNRDKESLLMEEHSATVSQQEAEKAQLLREIETLSAEIAELHKALNDAETLRQEEKVVNEKTLLDADSGKKAIKEAIAVLQAFYGDAAPAAVLTQVTSAERRGAYTPPNSDREGKTVGDLAPELSYSGDYNGKQDSSKGVIGLLEIILSDFDRTLTTVKQQEGDAVTAFDEFKKTTQAAIDAKGLEKTTKETAVTTAEDAIVAAKDSLVGATNLHAAAIEELEKLKAMCVDGEESFAERKEKREQEIEALKQAMTILEEWQA